MKISRHLSFVPCLACLLLPLHQVLAQSPESKHFRLEKLADGIYAAIHTIGGHAICNAGIVDLGDKTLVFDAFLSPEAAQDLRKAAEAVTSHPVTYVVNSHYHNDHIRGNQVFALDANIISTKWTRDAIAKHEPELIEQEKDFAPKRLAASESAIQAEKDPYKRQEQQMWIDYFQAMARSHPQLVTSLPNITFEDKLTIHGPKRTVELISYGPGHTESDLILYLPEEQIVFAGDLVFIGMHPYLADGSPEDWIEVLKKMKALGVRKVIPGHGPVGSADDISRMARYIETSDRLARKMIAEGKAIEDVLSQQIPASFETWWFQNFFRINLRFLYERAIKEGRKE